VEVLPVSCLGAASSGITAITAPFCRHDVQVPFHGLHSNEEIQRSTMPPRAHGLVAIPSPTNFPGMHDILPVK
jgi:hypothetical protein